MKKTVAMIIGSFFFNGPFLFSMEPLDDMKKLTKQLSAVVLADSKTDNQTSPKGQCVVRDRFEQAESCMELSDQLDKLIKKERPLSSLKDAFDTRSYISEVKIVEALRVISLIIPRTLDGQHEQEVLSSLHSDNRFFRRLVEHVMLSKMVEIDRVKGSTIDTMLSLKHFLPAAPSVLRQYILNKAQECFFKNNPAEHRHVFSGHTGPVLTIDYNKKIKQLASGSADKTVRLWDIETGECEDIFSCTEPIISLDYSTSSAELAIAADCNEVFIISSRPHSVRKLTNPEPITTVAWSQAHNRSQLLAVSNSTNMIYLWNMEESTPILTAQFELASLASLGFLSLWNDFSVEGNSIVWTKENELLALCKKALNNSETDKTELQKIYTSQSVSDLSKIDRKPFKAKLMACINALETGDEFSQLIVNL